MSSTLPQSTGQPPLREWSLYQQRIFDFVERNEGSAVIVAVAGSGKTTTIVECARRLPSCLKSIFVAFNKRIATELSTRLPRHIQARTLHLLGNEMLHCHLGRLSQMQLDPGKRWKLIKEFFPQYSSDGIGQDIAKLVSLAKGEGLGIGPSRLKDWKELAGFHGIELVEGVTVEATYRVLAESVRQAKSDRAVIDFDDQ